MRENKPSPVRLLQSVGEQDHSLGPATADVTLIEYGDFECPYSREGTRIARMLRDHFGDRLRFVFRHFPLTKHPHAQHAAETAEAAAAQGRFWDMVDVLFANQQDLSDRSLATYAENMGLDGSRVMRELRDHVHAARVRTDVVSGEQSGVRGTPTWFMNNERYDGPDDLETLRAILQRQIGKVEAEDA